MAQSHDELIAASEAAKEGSENRLTEVLATVLGAHHPLSAELFACRGLDAGVRIHGDLAARANSAGLEIREWDGHARIVRIKKPAEFVEGSDSLEGQADLVADFAREALSAAEDLDPGELQAPPTRGKGART